MTVNDLRILRNELRAAIMADVDRLYADEQAAIDEGKVGLADRLHGQRRGAFEAYQTVWKICQARIDALSSPPPAEQMPTGQANTSG